jgi:hypothetical protein
LPLLWVYLSEERIFIGSDTNGYCQDVIIEDEFHLDAEAYLTEYLVTPGIVVTPRAVPIGVLAD